MIHLAGPLFDGRELLDRSAVPVAFEERALIVAANPLSRPL
jgi:hypothetical protein